MEVAAVPVEGVPQAEAPPRHGPIEVDGLDVGLDHQADDFVEDGELAVAGVAEDPAQQGAEGDVADQGGGREGDEETAARAHGGSIARMAAAASASARRGRVASAIPGDPPAV